MEYGGKKYVSGTEILQGTGANWNLTKDERFILFKAIVDNGRPLTEQQLLALVKKEGLLTLDGQRIGSARFKNIVEAQERFIDNNATLLGYDMAGVQYDPAGNILPREGTGAGQGTLDPYFSDIYSLQEGTGGRAMYDELANVYQTQAGLAGVAADVQFQQAAMQQAQVVKQITDQVRAERMARLRAGMSESQIANQDMQQMMTNVNTLNQNAAMLNQGRIESQLGQMGAREQAYLTYLDQANQRGQVGAAVSAAEAGNAYSQALRRMQQTGENFSTAYKNVVTPGGS
jgi:hypothetical protein